MENLIESYNHPPSHWEYTDCAMDEYEYYHVLDKDVSRWQHGKIYDTECFIYRDSMFDNRYMLNIGDKFIYVYQTDSGTNVVQTTLKNHIWFKTEYRTKSQKRFDEYMKAYIMVGKCVDI